MAGTVTLGERKVKKCPDTGKIINIVPISWTGDASDGSVPDTSVPQLYGYVLRAIANPGSTAPTDNYDIKLLDPEDTSADALAGLLSDRDTANTESVIASGAIPPFLCGDYLFNLTGNSVNSATGTCILFLTDCL